jgi:glycosyltransferase involved in cell wall biosynthesis
MKVAIFTDNDFTKVNGVTTTLRAVLEHAPATLDLRVFTCESVGIDMPDYLALRAFGVGIPYYREMKMYWPPFRRFLRHARAARIDLVHYTTPGPVGLAAMWVARRLGVRMVGSFHTDLAEYARVLSGSTRLGDLMDRYMRWPYRKCERVFVPSEATRELLARGSVDPEKISIWRRGVSTTLFNPGRRSSWLRARWGAGDDRPVVVYVGRVSREKNLSMLGSLTRWLDDRHIAHRLVIVGCGPMERELRELCPGAVFTGTLPPGEVADAMASSDVFVFPSRTDTAGNVVLEAQASGLPVLVSESGGPRENITPDETGFICDSPDAFNHRAAQLLTSFSTRTAMGHSARAYALTRSWASALDPLYRSYVDAEAISAAAPLGARPSLSH